VVPDFACGRIEELPSATATTLEAVIAMLGIPVAAFGELPADGTLLAEMLLLG
jgi:hypothetical protein